MEIRDAIMELRNMPTSATTAETHKIREKVIDMAVEALEKQIPMQATYVYDDEFICPACSYEDDGYDVKTLKVCPECGQRLKWD